VTSLLGRLLGHKDEELLREEERQEKEIKELQAGLADSLMRMERRAWELREETARRALRDLRR